MKPLVTANIATIALQKFLVNLLIFPSCVSAKQIATDTKLKIWYT